MFVVALIFTGKNSEKCYCHMKPKLICETYISAPYSAIVLHVTFWTKITCYPSFELMKLKPMGKSGYRKRWAREIGDCGVVLDAV